MSIPNTTFRAYVEKLGATEAATFIGNVGDLFYDPNTASLKVSDGITPGGVSVAGVTSVSGPINQSLIPDSDDTYDLGSPSNQWRDLYLTGNTMYLGGTPVSMSGNTVLVDTVPLVSKPELDEATQDVANANALYVNTDVRVHQNNVIASPSPAGESGWYYSSLGEGEFCSWFFYTQAPDSEQQVTYADVDNVWMLYTSYDTNAKLPSIDVYSVPSAGANSRSWYKSRKRYSTDTKVDDAQTVLLWSGTTEPTAFPGVPRLQLTYDAAGSEGTQEDTEVAFATVLATDPSASANDYRFAIRTSGSRLSDRRGQVFLVAVDNTIAPDSIDAEAISTLELSTGTVNSNLIPKTDDLYSLGVTTSRWTEAHLSDSVTIGDKEITPTAASLQVNGVELAQVGQAYTKSEVDGLIESLEDQIESIVGVDNSSEFDHLYPGPSAAAATGKFYASIAGTYTLGDTYEQITRVTVSDTTPAGVTIDWGVVNIGDTLFIAEISGTDFGVYEVAGTAANGSSYDIDVTFRSGTGAPLDGERAKVYWAPGGSVNFEEAKDFFVSKSGDTMTGRLNVDQVGITSVATAFTLLNNSGLAQVRVEMAGKEIIVADGYTLGTDSEKISQIQAENIVAGVITATSVTGVTTAVDDDDVVPFHQLEEEISILQNEIDIIRDDINDITLEESGNFQLQINVVGAPTPGKLAVQVSAGTPGSTAPEQITIINVNTIDRTGEPIGDLSGFSTGDFVELSTPGGTARYTITAPVTFSTTYNIIEVAFESSTGGNFFVHDSDSHFTIFNNKIEVSETLGRITNLEVDVASLASDLIANSEDDVSVHGDTMDGDLVMSNSKISFDNMGPNKTCIEARRAPNADVTLLNLLHTSTTPSTTQWHDIKLQGNTFYNGLRILGSSGANTSFFEIRGGSGEVTFKTKVKFNNNPVKQVGDAVDSSDAVNLEQVDGKIQDALTGGSYTYHTYGTQTYGAALANHRDLGDAFKFKVANYLTTDKDTEFNEMFEHAYEIDERFYVMVRMFEGKKSEGTTNDVNGISYFTLADKPNLCIIDKLKGTRKVILHGNHPTDLSAQNKENIDGTLAAHPDGGFRAYPSLRGCHVVHNDDGTTDAYFVPSHPGSFKLNGSGNTDDTNGANHLGMAKISFGVVPENDTDSFSYVTCEWTDITMDRADKAATHPYQLSNKSPDTNDLSWEFHWRTFEFYGEKFFISYNKQASDYCCMGVFRLDLDTNQLVRLDAHPDSLSDEFVAGLPVQKIDIHGNMRCWLLGTPTYLTEVVYDKDSHEFTLYNYGYTTSTNGEHPDIHIPLGRKVYKDGKKVTHRDANIIKSRGIYDNYYKMDCNDPHFISDKPYDPNDESTRLLVVQHGGYGYVVIDTAKDRPDNVYLCNNYRGDLESLFILDVGNNDLYLDYMEDSHFCNLPRFNSAPQSMSVLGSVWYLPYKQDFFNKTSKTDGEFAHTNKGVAHKRGIVQVTFDEDGDVVVIGHNIDDTPNFAAEGICRIGGRFVTVSAPKSHSSITPSPPHMVDPGAVNTKQFVTEIGNIEINATTMIKSKYSDHILLSHYGMLRDDSGTPIKVIHTSYASQAAQSIQRTATAASLGTDAATMGGTPTTPPTYLVNPYEDEDFIDEFPPAE